MARTPSSTFLRRLLILANAPSAPQISLPSRSGHISPSVAISIVFSWDFFVCTSTTAVVELCSPCGEVPWSIVAVSRRVLASSRAMSHTVSVFYVWVFRTRQRRFTAFRNAKLSLKTLRTRLAVFEKESSVFPRRAPEAAEASRESATWGSDVELEAMESEQTGLAFSLPLLPEHLRVNSPVEFAHKYLCPSPEACDAVSFGLDDVLFTAASDSEDFGPALADAFPPSGQEAWPSAAYSELVDVLSRATEKLSIDWPDEPRKSQSSKLDERFLSGPNSRPERRKLLFFSDLHHEISRSWKQPFSSRLTNTAAADFTNLVGSVEQGYTAIPVIEDTLASHLSPSLAPSWKSRPLLPTKPCIGPLPPLSGSPTLQLVRQKNAINLLSFIEEYYLQEKP